MGEKRGTPANSQHPLPHMSASQPLGLADPPPECSCLSEPQQNWQSKTGSSSQSRGKEQIIVLSHTWGWSVIQQRLTEPVFLWSSEQWRCVLGWHTSLEHLRGRHNAISENTCSESRLRLREPLQRTNLVSGPFILQAAKAGHPDYGSV